MEKHRHYATFYIAGFSYWDGCIAFNQLSIGSELSLKREEDNKFDPYAVAVYFNEYKLGYIPRGSNHDISKFLEMGYTDIFEIRVNRLAKHEQPEQQVSMIVYLKLKN